MFEFICGPLQNSSHTITVQKSSTCLNDRPNSETEMVFYMFLLSRYRQTKLKEKEKIPCSPKPKRIQIPLAFFN